MALACDVSTARYWRGVPRTDDRKTLLACSSETVKLHTLVSTVRWLKEGTVWSVVHEIASPSWQETRSFVRAEWDRRFLNSFSVLRLRPKRCWCFLLLQHDNTMLLSLQNSWHNYVMRTLLGNFSLLAELEHRFLLRLRMIVNDVISFFLRLRFILLAKKQPSLKSTPRCRNEGRVVLWSRLTWSVLSRVREARDRFFVFFWLVLCSMASSDSLLQVTDIWTDFSRKHEHDVTTQGSYKWSTKTQHN